MAIFCLGVVQTREGWKGRAWKGGAGERERPTLRVESEGKVAPVLRAERPESRCGGGRRRRGEPRPARAAAWARGREPNSSPHSPARGPRPPPPCAAWTRPGNETFTRESERATRTQAPPGQRGGRASTQPLCAEPGGRLAAARPRPRGAVPTRAGAAGPVSLPRPDPKG